MVIKVYDKRETGHRARNCESADNGSPEVLLPTAHFWSLKPICSPGGATRLPRRSQISAAIASNEITESKNISPEDGNGVQFESDGGQ